MAKSALGKGLNALIPENDLSAARQTETSNEYGVAIKQSPSGVRTVPVGRVNANPDQPRRDFDETALRELADSVAKHGIIQPVVVEELASGEFMIVAGERRWRAAKLAGLREIPVVVRAVSDENRLEIALIENIQRENLNPIEEAEAYRHLMELGGFDQEAVAAAVGKNRSTVANALRLLKLPPEVLEAVRQDRISAGHARAILSAVNPADQLILFQRILALGMSVRQAESAASDFNRGQRGTSAPERKEREPAAIDPDIAALQDRLMTALGTKVKIEHDGKAGHIRIEYYSVDDLERVLGIISGA